MIKFGVAGSPDDFYEKGHKSALEMPQYLREIGLDAFEYQCGRGIRISEGTAKKLGEKARENGILMTIHSPYYINIATTDEQKKQNNIQYITKTLRRARDMGAERIVVHMGSAGQNRALAMRKSREFIPILMREVEMERLEDIIICFETMGKINQLGSLDETMEICALDERLFPAIDFGHLNARTHGGIKGIGDYMEILDTMESKLGEHRAKNFHAHFSKIMYTAGGESKHLTFKDKTYGPEFEPLAEAMAKKGATPVIICESRGTQGIDALYMKRVMKR
ncbi:MAG: TIM barrel protein [Clostridiales bacterium]|jgi:deoxyribonuclease-4|nr:TIM barrel protein [Clostridiales bacterium]